MLQRSAVLQWELLTAAWATSKRSVLGQGKKSESETDHTIITASQLDYLI